MRKALLFMLLAAPAPLLAGFTIELKTLSREVPVAAELDGQGRIMLDLVQVAEGLGGQVSIKDGEYVLSFASGTAVVNPDNALYRVKAAGKTKWWGAALEPRPYYSGSRLMAAMESVPALTFKTFTYHLQKKELVDNEVLDKTGLPPDKKAVPARHLLSGHKDWISLDDVAKALGIVFYSSRAQSYDLVLPDFTILELTIGGFWIDRKKEHYRPLEDPLLLFSGTPYGTISSLSAIFGVELAWDASSGMLVVPARYGRLSEVGSPERQPLTIVGYRPHPLKLSVDEMALFYQNPGPTYAADHPNVYESVRSFITNEPIVPPTQGFDRMSGDAVLNLDGSTLGSPLTGGGRFEKVGTRARLANGNLQWGFPEFSMKVSREYVNIADFSNQFNLLDNVTVSHANDAYGDGKANPSWEVKALYGQHLFSVFASTDILSQAVDFRQTVTGGLLDGSWKTAPGRSLSLSLAEYHFLNHTRQTDTEFNLTGDPFIDQILIQAGQTQAQSLTTSILTDRHDTSTMELSYRADGLFNAGASGGWSRFSNPDTGKVVQDGDWRMNMTLGDKHSRLAGSYERVGPQYRSIGSPLLYEDRSITRLSPYLDLSKVWKVYGEFRREDFHGTDEGIALSPYRSDFLYLTNAFNFSGFNLRSLVNKSEHTLYGKRWGSDLDFTKYIGRDSLDVGGGWASQWYAVGGLFKQSYTGRLGYQILRPAWKFSAGEDLTRDHYPKSALLQIEPDRWLSSSHVSGQWGKWQGFLQYSYEPRYYNQREDIHTGYVRFGHTVGDKKVFSVYYALTSLNENLQAPQVWRTGIEYVNDFY